MSVVSIDNTAWVLSLCGGFVLRQQDTPVHFARRKSQALIAWLALHPGWQPRKRIAQALWPDALPDDALRSLRVTLTDVRKTVGDALIERDAENRLCLSPTVYARGLDTDRLQAQAAAHDGMPLQATPQALAEGYQLLVQVSGHLLPEWDEAWLHTPQLKIRTSWQTVAQRVIDGLQQQSQWVKVLELTERGLTLHPSDEGMHQHRMMAFAGMGQRPAALKQYQLCRTALAEQGREPSEATKTLWQRLRQQENRGHAPRLGNLPRPLTSFIGREDELNQIETWLGRSRLLTLVGAGGSGKTRLAIQAAHEVAHAYPDGVWWVDLAALRDAAQIPHVLASLWQIRERQGAALLDVVLEQLSRLRLLLIFDNCEHLLEASARVIQQVLVTCLNINLLATSRQELSVEGEIIWQTPVLALPESSPVADVSASLSALLENDAIRLWVERTQLVMPGFQLTPHNAAQVVQLCHALQGIPLAIELAAAQMGVMPLTELLASLTSALDFQHPPSATDAVLHPSSQTRHRTLRAAIDWGYQLLTPAEQTLFRRMSVFAGGWPVELAAHVIYGELDVHAPLPLPSALGLSALPLSALDLTRQLLDGLTRKGVIQARRSIHGLRYAMLDALRDHARSLCEAAQEWASVQQAHFVALARWVQVLEPQLWHVQQISLAAQLQREAANIEVALSWGSEHLPPERVLAMVVNLARWWVLHSHFSWADRWLLPLLARCEQRATAETHAEHAALRANAWLWASDFAYRRSQAPTAIADAQKASALFAALHDELGLARAQAARGIGWWLAGDDEQAYQECEAAWQQLQRLRHSPHIHHAHYIGWSLIAANRLAEITRIQKRYAESIGYNQTTAAFSRELGDVRGEAISIGNLGLIAIAQHEWGKGCELLQTSARMLQSIGEKHHFTYALQGIGQACLQAGRYSEAARFYGALDRYTQETGYTLFGPDQLSHQQDLALLHKSMSASELEASWAAGAALNTEQAHVLVLDFQFVAPM